MEEDDQQLFKKAGGKEYTFKCEVSDSFGQTRRAVLPGGEKCLLVSVCGWENTALLSGRWTGSLSGESLGIKLAGVWAVVFCS